MHRGIGLPTDGVSNQGWKLYTTSLVMIIVAGLTTIGRCVTRFKTRQLGSDDVVVVCSLVFSIALSVSIQLAVENGYGMHKDDLRKAERTSALRWFFVAQTPYKVVVGLNKISVVLFCQRIFVGRGFKIACWSCMGIVAGWSIGAIAATIWQCVPIPGSWDKSIEAKCIDSSAFWTAYAVGNIFTDALVLCLPIPQILKLQLSVRERVMLCGIFLLGGFVLIAGIIRTTVVHSSLANQADVTYNFIPRGIWTLIEANLGIISACLPILKKPFNACMSRTIGTAKSLSRSQPFVGSNTPTFQQKSVTHSQAHTGQGKGTGPHNQLWEASSRKDSDVELLAYDLKEAEVRAVGGIVRKDSWTVTVESETAGDNSSQGRKNPMKPKSSL